MLLTLCYIATDTSESSRVRTCSLSSLLRTRVTSSSPVDSSWSTDNSKAKHKMVRSPRPRLSIHPSSAHIASRTRGYTAATTASLDAGPEHGWWTSSSGRYHYAATNSKGRGRRDYAKNLFEKKRKKEGFWYEMLAPATLPSHLFVCVPRLVPHYHASHHDHRAAPPHTSPTAVSGKPSPRRTSSFSVLRTGSPVIAPLLPRSPRSPYSLSSISPRQGKKDIYPLCHHVLQHDSRSPGRPRRRGLRRRARNSPLRLRLRARPHAHQQGAHERARRPGRRKARRASLFFSLSPPPPPPQTPICPPQRSHFLPRFRSRVSVTFPRSTRMAAFPRWGGGLLCELASCCPSLVLSSATAPALASPHNRIHTHGCTHSL